LGKIPENPNKIPNYLGKTLKIWAKWRPKLCGFEKWRPRFAEKQVKTIFLEVTPQKRSAKVARQRLGQV